MSIQNLLTQLDEIFERLGVAEKLAAPITDDELADFAESVPFKIPSSLESLYKWHNGMAEFIPAYDFLSLADALSQYQELIAFAEELQDKDFFKPTYFPILQFQDSWFAIDCASDAENIYDVYLEGVETHKEYESLEQFFRIVVDAYWSKAYYIQDDLLEENLVLFQKIKKKHFSQKQREEKEANWEQLCREVSNFSTSIRWNDTSLISRLTNTYDERAIEYLISFLKSRDPEVVATAAFGLGELKAREALPELRQLLKHPTTRVRNSSACAIGDIVTPEDKLLIQPLLELLTDKEDIVCINAIGALGQLKSSEATLPLFALLRSNNRWVWHVIQALGKIGDIRALEPLQLLKEEVSSGQTIWLIDQAISRIERANS